MAPSEHQALEDARPSSDIADPVLAGLLDELRDVNDRLQRYLAGGLVLTPPPSHADLIWPDCADDERLLTVGAAAERAGCSPDTVRRWCRVDGIGRLYGARWRVSRRRLSERIGV
ncbi:helix-turn-helix domain-containing protein [Methylobacterium segetis]|uniref:helix-turn-helix domain-containing protein n=1 Tax=Methylobacterium segetis TaxID=2488750 RepID=UPI00104B1A00|nr:helix-turn-helix domain-containing protein [Methylobacterium segetis]